jgi:DNA-directed RNA polymerase subunit RPC12/RpoP
MGYLSSRGRGKFLYVCDDCGNEIKMNMSAFAKRSRPRCMKCGSISLYPKTDTAKERIAGGQARALFENERLPK